jgi:WD40 repeat protein
VRFKSPAEVKKNFGQVLPLAQSSLFEAIQLAHERNRFNLEDSVNSVAFSPDGSKVVSGSWDGTIRLIDIESGSELAVFNGHEDNVNSLAFSPNGSTIVSGSGDYGSEDNTIRLWDVQSGSELAVFNLEDAVNSVAFSPDGSKIVSTSGDTIRLWDVNSGSELAVFNLETYVIVSGIFPGWVKNCF